MSAILKHLYFTDQLDNLNFILRTMELVEDEDYEATMRVTTTAQTAAVPVKALPGTGAFKVLSNAICTHSNICTRVRFRADPNGVF